MSLFGYGNIEITSKSKKWCFLKPKRCFWILWKHRHKAAKWKTHLVKILVRSLNLKRFMMRQHGIEHSRRYVQFVVQKIEKIDNFQTKIRIWRLCPMGTFSILNHRSRIRQWSSGKGPHGAKSPYAIFCLKVINFLNLLNNKLHISAWMFDSMLPHHEPLQV